jgi:hypothetical protein
VAPGGIAAFQPTARITNPHRSGEEISGHWQLLVIAGSEIVKAEEVVLIPELAPGPRTLTQRAVSIVPNLDLLLSIHGDTPPSDNRVPRSFVPGVSSMT